LKINAQYKKKKLSSHQDHSSPGASPSLLPASARLASLPEDPLHLYHCSSFPCICTSGGLWQGASSRCGATKDSKKKTYMTRKIEMCAGLLIHSCCLLGRAHRPGIDSSSPHPPFTPLLRARARLAHGCARSHGSRGNAPECLAQTSRRDGPVQRRGRPRPCSRWRGRQSARDHHRSDQQRQLCTRRLPRQGTLFFVSCTLSASFVLEAGSIKRKRGNFV
jgi:hypothetical protein